MWRQGLRSRCRRDLGPGPRGPPAASLGGVDVLMFTGGIGEHDAALRADTTAGLAFLGIGTILVVEAREDIEIADQTRALLKEG